MSADSWDRWNEVYEQAIEDGKTTMQATILADAVQVVEHITMPELEKMSLAEVDEILRAAGIDLDGLLRRIRERGGR